MGRKKLDFDLKLVNAQLLAFGVALGPTGLVPVPRGKRAPTSVKHTSTNPLSVNLPPTLNPDDDDGSNSDGEVDDVNVDNEGARQVGKPTRKKINVVWCKKPTGSPGRRKGGYSLKETLGMAQGGYLIVYGGVKFLLMRMKGIDMRKSISRQRKELVRHVVHKIYVYIGIIDA
ncbi:hypothetical protein FRC10_004330 [Ceratobasidium sp. 414]|nr:hypothetical protein FRC10_004330 [Ceratobasidium sp. 414]